MDEQPGNTVTDAPSGPAAHAARPRPARFWLLALAAATVVLAGVVIAGLPADPDSALSAPSSARSITVTPTVPLPPAELAALIEQPLDAGPLVDPGRRAACLAGLGYPSATVLGARAVAVNDRPAVVFVLAGEHPAELRAVAVWTDCGVDRTGLIAEQILPRP